MTLSPLASLLPLETNRRWASGLTLVAVNSMVPFPSFLELSCQRVQGIAYPRSANQGFDLGNPKGWKRHMAPCSGPFCHYCVLDHESLVNLQFRFRNSGDGIREQGSRVIESLQTGHCAWQWTTFMVPRQVCGQEQSEDPVSEWAAIVNL